MDNLTKENFFNELYSIYPKEMEVFCKWIDEYKSRMHWSRIFKDIEVKQGNNFVLRPPKYHELPIAFQIGIFIQFTTELKTKRFNLFNDFKELDDFVYHIRQWFYDEQLTAI